MKYLFGRAVLTIKQLRPEDSGMYMVKVHNGSGDARSSATLRTEPAQQRGDQFGGASSYRSQSSTSGSYQNAMNIDQSYDSSKQQQQSYNASSRSSVVPQHDGYAPQQNGYKQLSSTTRTTSSGPIYDDFDKITRTTTTKTTYNTSVNVVPAAPTFMKHLEPDYNVLEGSRLHMEVRATGQGDDLVFTWLKNGEPIHSGMYFGAIHNRIDCYTGTPFSYAKPF